MHAHDNKGGAMTEGKKLDAEQPNVETESMQEDALASN